MGASASQTGLSQAEPVSRLGPPSRVVDMRAWRMLERIVDATHSHIDGRDLLGELHPRKTLDIKRRVDGRETWFEGDWLSGLWGAVKEARALLYTKGREQATTYRNTGSPEESASAGEAGTATTTQIDVAHGHAVPNGETLND